MKKLIISTFFIFIFSTIYGQWSNKFLSRNSSKHFLYASGDVIAGNYIGGDLGINYMFNSRYLVKFGFSAANKQTSTQPFDFLKSSESEIPPNFNLPSENFENFHIMFGKVISFNSIENIRIILQAGPAVTNERVPTNWQWRESNQYLTNYDYDIQKKTKLSLMLNPKIEFPLCCMVGFSIGPMVLISKENSFYGAGIGIMYGIIRSNTN